MPIESRAIPVLRCRAIVKSYRQGAVAVPVLQGLELEAAPGATIGIMGSSGSGKSTLLNLIGGLDRPDTGSVELLGRDLGRLSDQELARTRNRHLGFVYQFHHLLAEFSALENATMPLLIAGAPGPWRAVRPPNCWRRWVSAIGWTTAREPCPAANANGSPSPGRSPTGRIACSWTNPQATSIAAVPSRSWSCCCG